MSFVATLQDEGRSYLPPSAFDLALYLAIAGVCAAGVVGWFHGEKGRQMAPPIEYLVLGIITIVWLGASIFRLVDGGL